MLRFLQISDIHFADESIVDDEYRQMKCKFLEDIEECYKQKGIINNVLICGDVAYSGKLSQYKKAKGFIADICDKIKCSENNVFVVPGNHDKEWDCYRKTRYLMRNALLDGNNTEDLFKFKVKEPMTISILYAPFKNYYEFAYDYSCISDVASKVIFPLNRDKHYDTIPKFEPDDCFFWTDKLNSLSEYSVFIHGGNSSLMSDNEDGDSKNLQTNKHLQILPLQSYNVSAGCNEIHILMLHHPMSEIIDGKKKCDDIDCRFKLQLYGHIHEQSSSSYGTIKIFSGALQPEKADEGKYFPVYNIIDMDVIEQENKLYLQVNIYSRKWNGTEFEEYSEETKYGDNALKVELQKNNSWNNTKTDSNVSDNEIVENPHAIKNAFLRSGYEGKIIKEMFDDEFDNISPNHTKYLAFLKQVECDGRISELNKLLKKYGK